MVSFSPSRTPLICLPSFLFLLLVEGGWLCWALGPVSSHPAGTSPLPVLHAPARPRTPPSHGLQFLPPCSLHTDFLQASAWSLSYHRDSLIKVANNLMPHTIANSLSVAYSNSSYTPKRSLSLKLSSISFSSVGNDKHPNSLGAWMMRALLCL